jgi:hypothetical protein
MRVLILSYSLSGNNDALAAALARQLEARHLKVTEARRRTNGTIALDMLFNRTPRINPLGVNLGDYDFVLFVGPVWMGQAAAPLRACFRLLREGVGKYGWVSISGGALGPNPRLTAGLKKRIGREPAAVIDMQIVDLLPANPKPSSKDTSEYRLTDEDVESLAKKALGSLKEAGL